MGYCFKSLAFVALLSLGTIFAGRIELTLDIQLGAFEESMLKALEACTIHIRTIGCEDRWPSDSEVSSLIDTYFRQGRPIMLTVREEDDYEHVNISYFGEYQGSTYAHLKFQECSADVYIPFFDYDFHSVGMEQVSRYLRNYPAFIGQKLVDPDFIVILESGSYYSDFYDIHVMQFWEGMMETSAATVLLRNRESAALYCYHCDDRFTTGMERTDLLIRLEEEDFDKNFIRDLHFQGRKNYQKGHVLATGHNDAKCSLKPPDISTPPTACLVQYSAQYLNATLETDYESIPAGYPPLGEIFVNYYFESSLMRQISMSWYTEVKLFWVPLAEERYWYTYVLVSEIEQGSVSSLWRVLDYATWFFTALTIISTALVLSLRSRRKSVMDGLKKFAEAFTMLAVFLIDRGGLPQQGTKVMTATVAGWILSTIILSGGYKGAIYSSLTHPTPPAVPMNLEEMIDHPFTIVSTSRFSTANEGVRSLLHASLEDIKLRIEENAIGDRITLWETVTKLYDKLIFVNSSISDVVRHVTTAGMHRLPLARVKDGSNIGTKFSLPRNHIFVGSFADVNIYTALLQSSGIPLVVIRGPRLELFSEIVPVLAQRSLFYQHFMAVLYKIYESGLYHLWSSINDQLQNIISLRMLREGSDDFDYSNEEGDAMSIEESTGNHEDEFNKQELDSTMMELRRKRNINVHLFNDFYSNNALNLCVQKHGEIPLGMDVLKNMFVLYSLLLVAALIMCCMEKLSKIKIPYLRKGSLHRYVPGFLQ